MWQWLLNPTTSDIIRQVVLAESALALLVTLVIIIRRRRYEADQNRLYDDDTARALAGSNGVGNLLEGAITHAPGRLIVWGQAAIWVWAFILVMGGLSLGLFFLVFGIILDQTYREHNIKNAQRAGWVLAIVGLALTFYFGSPIAIRLYNKAIATVAGYLQKADDDDQPQIAPVPPTPPAP